MKLIILKAKNNFDPSVGLIDTSNWLSSSGGNGGPGGVPNAPPSGNNGNPNAPGNPMVSNQQRAMNSTPNSVQGVRSNDWNPQQGAAPSNQFTPFAEPMKNAPGRQITGSNGPSQPNMAQNPSQNSGNPSVPPFTRMNSMPNSSSMGPSAGAKMPIGAPGSVPGSSNPVPAPNNAVPSSLGNANMPNSAQNTSAPQIQHQLIESFRLAVATGLISADLLNTKLPQEVLTMLYQLFQYQNQYMNCQAKADSIQKRRTQMNSGAYKQESEIIANEMQMCRDQLTLFKNKIAAAHMMIKGGMPITPTPNAPKSSQPNGVTQPGSPLFGVDPDPLSQSLGLSSSQKELQKSKLQRLLEPSPIGRGSGTQQPNSKPAQNQPNLYQQFGANASSQWNSPSPFQAPFDSSPYIDDRITPFVPGKLWTGTNATSIEDDPNCTPGSVSKSLLTETFDPESILNNLQHRSQWPDALTTNTSTNQARTSRGNSWSNSYNQVFSPPQSQGASSQQPHHQSQAQFGADLWSMGSSSSSSSQNKMAPQSRQNVFGGGGAGAGGMAPQRMNSQQPQSAIGAPNQFSRSNSWNVSPQQQQQQQNSQWNSPYSNSMSQYVMVKNIPAVVS